MAENPWLLEDGRPVAFDGEELALRPRDGFEFHVNNIKSAPDGYVRTMGKIYLTNIRMVFVARRPIGNFFAFEMPLLNVRGEKFNRPIFRCNNISGFVEPVVSDNQNRSRYATRTFKILFREGGWDTFVPHFIDLIGSVRRDGKTPVDDMTRRAQDANRMLSFYAPEWSGEVRNIIYPGNGTVTVVYRVMLRGTYGEAYREATGTARVDDGRNEDAVAAAEKAAFCNAYAQIVWPVPVPPG